MFIRFSGESLKLRNSSASGGKAVVDPNNFGLRTIEPLKPLPQSRKPCFCLRVVVLDESHQHPDATHALALLQRRIRVLINIAEGDPEAKARVEAFRRGLQERGWIEGRKAARPMAA